MGVLNKLLDFGNSKRGKIITWSVVGAGVLVFVIGVLMAAISPAPTSPIRIQLSAPNMVHIPSGSSQGYHLEATAKQTAITVHPTPRDATASVTFTVATGANMVSITPKVPAGGTAVLTLTRIHQHNHPDFPAGIYGFQRTDDETNRIRIDVRSGNRTEVIFVRIIFKPEAAHVTATLQRERSDFLGHWTNTDRLEMMYFTPHSGNDQFGRPLLGMMQYRIKLEFFIFGELIFDTARNPGLYHHFDHDDIDPKGASSIRLWRNTGLDILNPDIIDPPSVHCMCPPRHEHIVPCFETFEFSIWVEFSINTDLHAPTVIRYQMQPNFNFIVQPWVSD